MVRRISAQEARDNFADLLGSVRFSQEPVIVERRGKPYAVLISPEQFDRIQDEEQKRLEEAWQTVERVQERNVAEDPDEVYREVTALVEEVRQEAYDRQNRIANRGR